MKSESVKTSLRLAERSYYSKNVNACGLRKTSNRNRGNKGPVTPWNSPNTWPRFHQTQRHPRYWARAMGRVPATHCLSPDDARFHGEGKQPSESLWNPHAARQGAGFCIRAVARTEPPPSLTLPGSCLAVLCCSLLLPVALERRADYARQYSWQHDLQ